jgi:hypothetical protein
MGDAGVARGGAAAPAVMAQVADGWVSEAFDDRPAVVVAAVVDDDNLEIPEALRQDALQRPGEKSGAVASGYNHTDLCHKNTRWPKRNERLGCWSIGVME